MTTPDAVVERLRDTLARDEGLAELLERSLVQAGDRARGELDQDVYAALEWPETLAEYEEYLKRFIRWIPRQSSAKAWKKSAPGERYAKEVSDRLAHFFWLVDQKVDEGETAIAENSDAFRDWLTEFARQWGSFLDTPESFSQEILDSFLDDAPEYDVEASLVNGVPNEPSGWLTFNQFFARRLNSGLRPVSEPLNNLVVTSPADCSFQRAYDIDAESNIPATTLKATHKYGNIKQLIEGSRYAEAFAGGRFAHYMLPPSAYHRFHLPVAGRVEESFVVQGKVFMQVDLEDHQLQSKDSAETGYEFSQTRGVVTIDTSESDAGDIGVVGVVSVGMSHVASVVLTATQGTRCAKGEEFGYFQFGGSDIILLFQEGVDPEIDTSEDFRLVGSPAARCPRLLAT
jgi:phosphatidylserine decarboxylase precursor